MINKLALILTILLLTCMTVQLQIEAISWDHVAGGRQVERHRAVLRGKAGSPWQYRVLPEYVLVGMKRLFSRVNIHQPRASAFVSLRYLQNILIFSLFFMYSRLLGMAFKESLLAVVILGWVCTQAFYNSDLQFSTYFDVIFYLTAAIALLKRQYALIPLITLVASFNRETSGLIPILCAGCFFIEHDKKIRKQLLLSAAIGLVMYLFAFFVLRAVWGSRDLIVVYSNSPGWEMFYYNVKRSITWVHLLGIFSVMPLLTLLRFNSLPPFIKMATFAIVPFWTLIHLFMSVLAEARLMLVPIVVCLLPATMLFCLRAEGE